MKLSVIIVSYNVRYFLEKCLVSVFKALHDIDGEVIVIDNNSSDQSVHLVRSRFPKATLIANPANVGFGKACNQGLRICQGEYVLLLNPDTLVSEQTFTTCISFMDSHPNASACAVRMVDGTGSALPESMRGLPTPISAFFKMSGISALFPNSPVFNGYYMGGVDRSVVQAVPVLTGAFMFMRMEVIREIGMLDEDYFMYGEDIDLCYRMVQAGYQNYYLPEPAIIHYKGESTQREQLKYVRHFYNAMVIYVRKHYHGAGGKVFRLMIILGVFTRGAVSVLRRFVRRVLPILIDGAIIIGTLLVVKGMWARYYFNAPGHFDQRFTYFNIPLYAALWMLFLFLSGAHDSQRNARRIMNGMLFGTIAILLTYAILPLELRSSRAVILISALFASVLLILSSVVWKFLRRVGSVRRIAVVGNNTEAKRVMEILNRSAGKSIVVGWIAVDDDTSGTDLIGHVSQLQTLVKDQAIGELVFSQDLPFSEINTWMSKIGPAVSYRISSTGSDQIVGSDSSKEQGHLYRAEVEFALAYPMHRRLKRIFDVLVGAICLLIWPIAWALRRSTTSAWKQCLSVLAQRKTWVGYHPNDSRADTLPAIRDGVIHPAALDNLREPAEIHMINYIYAREYHVWKDVDIVLRNLSKII